MNTPEIKELVGMPLSIVRHAASMLNLQFGEVEREGDKSWGQYALHIQAPWRVINGTNLLIGSEDHWNPAKEIDDRDQWYENPHPSLEDQFWEKFIGGIDSLTNSFEGKTPKVKVKSICEERIGDLTIKFDNGYQLQTFGNGIDNEFWRLLQPGLETEHYVVGTARD